PLAQKLVGCAVIAALSGLNILGVKPGGRTVTLLTIVKIGALALLIGAGMFVAFEAPPSVSTTTVAGQAFKSAGPLTLLAAFGAALVPVLFTYGGWQQLNFVAEEVHAAEKKIPVALV